MFRAPRQPSEPQHEPVDYASMHRQWVERVDELLHVPRSDSRSMSRQQHQHVDTSFSSSPRPPDNTGMQYAESIQGLRLGGVQHYTQLREQLGKVASGVVVSMTAAEMLDLLSQAEAALKENGPEMSSVEVEAVRSESEACTQTVEVEERPRQKPEPPPPPPPPKGPVAAGAEMSNAAPQVPPELMSQYYAQYCQYLYYYYPQYWAQFYGQSPPAPDYASASRDRSASNPPTAAVHSPFMTENQLPQPQSAAARTAVAAAQRILQSRQESRSSSSRMEDYDRSAMEAEELVKQERRRGWR